MCDREQEPMLPIRIYSGGFRKDSAGIRDEIAERLLEGFQVLDQIRFLLRCEL
jgi:hypothetical protein